MPVQTRSQKILFAGDHNLGCIHPVFQRGQPIYVWAERGLICLEDAATNTYKTESWQTMAQRTLALSDMVKNTPGGIHSDERVAIQRIICKMDGIIRQAKEQGSPDNPDAAAEYARRRAKRSLVPAKIQQTVYGDVRTKPL